MPAYDSKKFDPPAPSASVIVRNPETGATWSDVQMLLDYGADVTMIPQAASGLLGLMIDLDRQYELKGFDGHRSSAPVVQADIIFERRQHKNFDFEHPHERHLRAQENHRARHH
ncbi:MAG: hypothetical protein ACREOI_37765 [bacterium]